MQKYSEHSQVLRLVLWAVSLIMIANFAFGVLTFSEHWWVLSAWFFPLAFGGGLGIARDAKSETE